MHAVAQARGILWGLALGDALGWPVEFLDIAQIRAKYGPAGITEPPNPALYTDDTQMTLAVADALIEAGYEDLDTLMNTMARQFIEWKNDPVTPSRAPGSTSILGVSALERGAAWRESGVKNSKGCGACMRVAPVGFFYQRQARTRLLIAKSQGWLTHRHRTADAACAAGAHLIALALEGAEPAEFPAQVLEATTGISSEFDAAVQRVLEVIEWSDEEAALNVIGPTRGGGWIAEEAIAMALYCVMRRPDDFAGGVQLAANISGDSDSVAALTGGILGARLGPDALPADWLERLEHRDLIAATADRLAHKRARAPSAATL